MYVVDSGTEKQYVIFMGKRQVDGESPIDVAKLEGESGIELINNGLGSGVLMDEDGNITSDDNKQQGSVAINMDGLGAAVTDDLCILTCKFTLNFINMETIEADRSGFDVTGNKALLKSMSGNAVELGAVAGSNTSIAFDGYAYKTSTPTYYATGSTFIEAAVSGDEGYTLGTVNTSSWAVYAKATVTKETFVTNSTLYTESSGTFSAVSSGTFNAATTYYEKLDIRAFMDSNKTILVRVPNNTDKVVVKCTATASA